MESQNIFTKFTEQSASVLYFTIDANGLIISANKFAQNLCGKNCMQTQFIDLIVSFNEKFKLHELIEFIEPVKLDIQTQKGLPKTIYFTFTKEKDVIYALGESIFKDAEQLELRMVQLNNELSNLTRELHQKNAELNKLNQLKNQFLGMAAHDLRNPLLTIRNYAEFLIEDESLELQEFQKQYLALIFSSSTFMFDLVNNFLDVSIIESGKLEVETTYVLLPDTIRQAVALNQHNADKKSITLTYICEENIPGIYADAQKLMQVMNNLLSNAIKFSTRNTQVKVTVKNIDDALQIAVSDQGKGIAEEELNKLFKPFGKTSTKSTEGEKSTGLGLMIAKKIIEAHNGKIWVESTLNMGTTFYFSLPNK